ncbi:MAG: Ig-like domain-containing protein [Planctomycetales bacterium]|nr:Ig-like domain-containing protein [Planctomycetales bacterium]
MLPTAGNYTIRITSAASVSYDFTLHDVPAPVATAVSLDTVYSSSISDPGSVDVYTFDNTDPSQHVYFDVVSGRNSRVNWRLSSPTGAVVFSSALDDQDTTVLSEIGTYTLTVDPNNDLSHSYSVEWVDVPAPVATPINLDAPVSDSIVVRGEVDLYTFSGSAGQNVFFDYVSGPSAATFFATLTAPSGANVFGGFIADHDVTLSETGTYTLTIDGWEHRTDSYTFEVVSVANPAIATVALGDVVNGDISNRGELDLYEFDLVAGQQFFPDVQTGGVADFVWNIVDPTGTTLLSDLWRDQSAEFTATATGTYTMTVDGLEDHTGPYTVQLWDSTDLGPTAIQTNTNIADTLAPKQIITYTFNALTGDELILDVVQNQNTAANFVLADPTGAVLQSITGDTELSPLPVDGTYTLTLQPLSASDHDLHGDFEFRLQEKVIPPAIGDPDSDGAEYWLAFPSATTTQTYTLLVSAEQDTDVVVHIPSLNYYDGAEVPAGSLTSIDIPAASVMSRFDDDIIENKGVHVLASAEVTVHVVMDGQFSSDAYLAVPTDGLGTDHIVVSQTRGCPLGCGDSEFTIVATEDNTSITITPTRDIQTHPAGVPYNVFLDEGQTYRATGGSFVGLTELTGTSIVSDKPVFVLGANQATEIPSQTGQADFLIEQLPPVNSWGRQFITAPLANRVGGDQFKIVASEDNTDIEINGVPIATLNRGEFHSQIIDGPAEITASEPVYLAQYALGQTFDNPADDPAGPLGDPMMMQIPPYEQYRTEYTLGIPGNAFVKNYINVTAPDQAVGQITLDGVVVSPSDFTQIGTSGYSYAQLAVTPGTYRLESPVPVGATVYGFGDNDAYGYTGGTSLGPVAAVQTLDVSPAASVLLPNNTHTVTASVADDAGNPLEHVKVDFFVSGTHTPAGFDFTDATGSATFSYFGDTAGTDTIIASVGTISASATADWLGASPEIFITSPTNNDQFNEFTTTLITGRVLPSPTQSPIVAVTVNQTGTQPAPVDSFDASGNFFTSIEVQSGIQTLTFTAIDASGQSESTTLTIEGVVPQTSIDTSQFSDITLEGSLEYTRTTFNRSTRELHADVRLTNQADTGLGSVVLAAYSPFDPLAVDLTNSEGTIESAPYVSFDDELGATLPAGSTSQPIGLTFGNAAHERFDFEVLLYSTGNSPPEFTSSPVTNVAVDTAYTYQSNAVDSDNDALTFALQLAPSTMSINAAGLINWTPVASDLGTHVIELVADDGNGATTTQSFQLEVTVAAPNHPPVFTSSPLTVINSGENYSYTPSVSDADGDTVAFSLDSPPADMTIDSATGEVTFSSPADGSYPITIIADDGNGGSAVQSFTLSVGNVSATNNPPVLTSVPTTDATVGSLYLYFAQATDPDGDTLTFDLLASPSGMTVDQITGRVAFTPASAGPAPALLVVTDGNGGSTSQSFTIDVSPVPPNQPPSITSAPEFLATESVPYSYAIIAEDPEGSTVSYSLGSGPTGMTVNSTTGLLEWLAPTVGTEPISIVATDAAGLAAMQTFDVEIRATNTAPDFQTTPVEEITAGAEYRYAALATDAEDGVTYSLETAPTGMRIGALNGIIFWNTDLSSLGDHPITIRATDDRGLFTDQSFTLTVTPDVVAPLVNVTLGNTLVNIGDTVRIEVQASDNVAVDTIELEIDGLAQTLDANNGMFYTATSGGLPNIVGIASDTSGNVGIGVPNPSLRILDPSDTTPPVVEITSPAPGDIQTYLTEVFGTVTDDNLEFYRLEYSLAGANEWVTVNEQIFQPGLGGIGVTDSFVGTFDPTLLANDTYDVRLFAQDTNGQTAFSQIELYVESQAKLGNFRLEFTDLTIPIAGIPISINRVYDTLEANISSDFGFGWSLSAYTPRIRETTRLSQAEQAGVASLFGANPFREGTRVYLTTPSGRRVGFTFDPQPVAGLLGVIWKPRFTPDPGVYDTLEVDNVNLSQNPDGTFGIYLFGFPYNPDSYTLTTKDQRRYRIDQFGGLQDITDRNNVVLSFEDNGIFSSVGQSIEWLRDEQGRITQIIDPAGNSIHYEYHPTGDLASVTDQVFNTTSMTYLSEPGHYLDEVVDPLANVVSKTIYDDDGRVDQVFDALGNPITQTYDLDNNRETISDRLGNPTTLVFNDRGLITEEIDALGNSMLYTYDNNDNELTITNKRGYTTSYEYDSRGNATKVTDTLGGEVVTTYNDRNDVLTVVDQLGRVTENVYDSNGNLIEQIDALGNSMLQTFDTEGRVLTRTDRNGHTTSFEYSTDCGCPNSPSRIVYPDGDEKSFAYNFYGQATTETDELGHATTRTYDKSGRPLSTIGPDGQSTTNVYTGQFLSQQITKINATENRVTYVEYDPEGNVIEVTDANGGETEFTYDAETNLASLTDPVGNTTTFEYDALQRLIVRRDPLLNETRYDYDEEGNLVEILDRVGRFRQFEYDELNRQTSEHWLAPDESHVRTISSTYDPVDNLLTQSDPNSSYTWTYDELNRVISEDNSGAPGLPHVVMTWEYDKEGNRTAVYDNSGVRVDSIYSDRNELLSKLWHGGGIDDARVDFSYNERGERVATERYSDLNGTNSVGRSAMAYDNSGRASGITHLDSVDGIIADYDYLYDFANQLIQELNHGETIDYGYDLFGQLTSVDRAVFQDEFYTYDLNGNRTASHLHGSDYVTGQDNRLLADGEFTYEYDSGGHLIRKTEVSSGNVTDFSYDHRDRLTTVSEKTAGGIILNEVNYTYDTGNRRISTTTNGQVLYFSYDGHNVWADFDASGTAVSRYLFGDVIDENIARFQLGTGVNWYFADKSGSVVGLSDIAGGLSGSRIFDSFGNALASTGNSLGRYAFTGREFDSAANAYFYRARFYSSQTGKFLSLDPIGFNANDTNLYRYAINSPTNATDPHGLASTVDYAFQTAQLSVLGCTIGLLLKANVATPNEALSKFASSLGLNFTLGLIPAASKAASNARIAALGLTPPPGASTVSLPFVALTTSIAKCGGAF